MFVAQSQREPLEDFALGASSDGVESTLFYRRRISDEFEVRIRRVDHIAKEISLELPFLRTQARIEQIRQFEEFLGEPRKKLRMSVSVARETLNNTERGKRKSGPGGFEPPTSPTLESSLPRDWTPLLYPAARRPARRCSLEFLLSLRLI